MANRVLKFRAWDIKSKSWASPCNVVMSLHGKELYWNFGYESLEDLCNKDFIIVQFTGLKDKNGKEIYDGDIVSFGKYTGTGDFVGTDCTHLVKWDDSNARFITFAIKENHDSGLVDNNVCEVIGNIYENPELFVLKQEGVKDGN